MEVPTWSTNREIVDGIKLVLGEIWCKGPNSSIVDIGVSVTELLAVISTVRLPFSLKICDLYFETEN